MGTCWAHYIYTFILACFCTVFLVAGATTEAHAWATDFVRATDQPDYPGVIKCFIDRKAKDGGAINMYYPKTENAVFDTAIQEVIDAKVKSFESDSSEDSSGRRAISSNYVIHRPVFTSLSVEFTICEEDGKAFCYKHNLNLGIVDSRVLTLEDMFKDPQLALNLMSAWSRRKLSKNVEALWDKKALYQATEPTAENFHNLLIVKQGLRIVFSPGQVGPMAIGDPELTMPIKELAAAGPKPDVWGEQKSPLETALSTPLRTPVTEKIKISQEDNVFLVPTGDDLTFPCTVSGSEVENCIRIRPDFVAHFENDTSDYGFVQGQVALAGEAEATYVWGLYRTSYGFRSTYPALVCRGCKPDKVFIKKDVIMFSKIKQMPSDAQAVDLKFRIVDGYLKKAN